MLLSSFHTKISTGRVKQSLRCNQTRLHRKQQIRAQSSDGDKTRTTDSFRFTGLDIDGMRPTTPKAWQIMSEKMKRSKVRFISPGELEVARGNGKPVIDVRPPTEYRQGFLQGAVNVPLYRLIEGWDSQKVMRRLGYAFFGVFNGTEINENFMQELQEAAPDKEQGAILICNLGGSLSATQEFKRGQQSRSLIAAYELVKAGYGNVWVLEGGYNAWVRDGRDVYMFEEEA